MSVRGSLTDAFALAPRIRVFTPMSDAPYNVFDIGFDERTPNGQESRMMTGETAFWVWGILSLILGLMLLFQISYRRHSWIEWVIWTVLLVAATAFSVWQFISAAILIGAIG